MAQKDVDFSKVEAVSLFDGKTFNGGNGTWDMYRIEDGAIVGGSLDKPNPKDGWVATVAEFYNFELRIKAKLVNEIGNAGVQFRSRWVGWSKRYIVQGYQADIGISAGRSVWGALYDESRRRRMLVQPEAKLLESIVKPNDWNAIRVICRGPRIQIFVNGHQTVDYTERDQSIPLQGVIGLQIHGGNPSEAWYRNIRIRQL